eukprot:2313134-Prymnesium_polylepis.1
MLAARCALADRMLLWSTHPEHIRSTRGAPCENLIVSDVPHRGLLPTRKRLAEVCLLPYIKGTDVLVRDTGCTSRRR